MERPNATIDEVWRQHRAWDCASDAAKRVQENSRLWALLLGVLGALLGALAAWAAGGAGEVGASSGQVARLPERAIQALSIGAALSLGLAAFVGRELLTLDRETGWARARMLSEALKRECWRCLLGAPPYDTHEAGSRLAERARALTANLGLHREAVAGADQACCPQVSSIDDYIGARALDQQAYYERRASQHRSQLRNLKRLAFLLGALAIALGVVGAVPAMASAIGFVPVLTTAAGAVVAWIQAGRLASMVGLYQDAASQLSLVIALWRDGEGANARLQQAARAQAEFKLLETCEAIMARENESWRAEWLSEEKVNEALSRIDSVASVTSKQESS